MRITYLIVPASLVNSLNKKEMLSIQEFINMLKTSGLSESLGAPFKDIDYIVIYTKDKGRESIKYWGYLKVGKVNGKLILRVLGGRAESGLKRPIDSIHKFWARKPWWAVSQYILRYTSKGDVILDPMCGSGIIGYEALRLRRRAILVDLNPFAVFLTRNTLKPIATERLKNAFKEVLERPINKDIRTYDGEILVKRGTKVKEAILKLYETKCRECGETAYVQYYIWDTIYELKKEPSTDEQRIFIEALRKVFNLKEGREKISQIELMKKWKDVKREAERLWDERKQAQGKNPFRGSAKPAQISEFFGKLVRSGVFVRAERRPVLISYKCDRCSRRKGRQKSISLYELNDHDLKLIDKIEKVIIPYPYPQTSLKYSEGQPFDTARPDSVFISDERLRTWSEKEAKDKDLRVYHLFTKRNLLALAILFWSINQVKDIEVREKLYLAFTETLYKVSKLNSYEVRAEDNKLRVRRATLWREPRFSVPPDFAEENVLLRFEREFESIKEANEQAVNEIGSYYKEATTPYEFITNQEKTVLLLRYDAKELDKVFKQYKDVVDMVFTDPPYGDAIQYFELTTFWTSWLQMDKEWVKRYGNSDWWKEEIVVNKRQNKGFKEFRDYLSKVFDAATKITKENAWWVITYHKRDPKYWNALTEAMLSVGLGFYSEERHQLLGRSFNPSKDFRFLGTDAYTVWRKSPKVRFKSLKDAVKIFFDYICEDLKKNNGLATRDSVERAFIEMAWSIEPTIYQRFFEGKLDEFLSKYTIQIPLGSEIYVIIKRNAHPRIVSHALWVELWDKCYESINRKDFLRKLLTMYIKSRENAGNPVGSIDEIFSEVINGIDGNINKELVFQVLNEVATYNYAEGVYKLKRPGRKDLLAFISKPKQIIQPPEVIVERIASELLRKGFLVYVRDTYPKPKVDKTSSKALLSKSRIYEDLRSFPIVFVRNDKYYCIDINNADNASRVLITEGRANVIVIILYGNKKVEEKVERHLRKYREQGRLYLVNVHGKNTEKIIDEILKISTKV